MGAGCFEANEAQDMVVSTNELKSVINLCQRKCKIARNKRYEVFKKNRYEITKCVKQNNLDLAITKGNDLLKDENYITALDILDGIFTNIKDKCFYIATTTQCPENLRTSIDSVIYASTRLEVKELMTFRGKISKKYGNAYVTKADNDEDKLVNKDLVQRLKVTDFSQEAIKTRINQLWAQRRSLLMQSSIRASMKNNSQINNSTINQGRYNNQQTNQGSNINISRPSVGQSKNNPQINDGKNGGKKEDDPLLGQTLLDTVHISRTKESSKQSQPSNSNINPIENKKSLEEQLNNDIDLFGGKTNETIYPSNIQNNQHQPQQPKNEGQLNNNDDIFGGKTNETIHFNSIKINQQQPQQPNIEDQLNNDVDVFGGKTSQTIYMGNNQANPQPQNIGVNNDIDLLGGETLKTMHLSIANPDNKENPFEGNINDNNQFQPFPTSGRLLNINNDNKNDIFGGPTLPVEEIPINKGGVDPFDPNAKIDDIFGGPTLPFEEVPINKGGVDPFDPNAKIDDVFGGPTLPFEEIPINNGVVNPFDPNAKVDDPFGGPTLKEE